MEEVCFEENLKKCMSKPWFIKKCASVFNIVTKSTEEYKNTEFLSHLAEHNRLQNNFLSKEFQTLIVKKCVGDYSVYTEDEIKDIDAFYNTELYKKCMNDKKFNIETYLFVEFNPNKNWDIVLRHKSQRGNIYCDFENKEVVNYHIEEINDNFENLSACCGAFSTSKLVITRSECDQRSHIFCIIKPSLGDGYPCVLSEINIEYKKLNKNDDYVDIDIFPVLLVERFNAIHTSKEQLIKIFEMSEINVFFIDELLYHSP